MPIPQTEAVVPDVLLMPPVGFDADGYRLGYGGGFFDRTLAAAAPHPLKIGLAREASRIDTIHPQPHDVPMDFVVTERGIHECATSACTRRTTWHWWRRVRRLSCAKRQPMQQAELAPC